MNVLLTFINCYKMLIYKYFNTYFEWGEFILCDNTVFPPGKLKTVSSHPISLHSLIYDKI